MLGVLARRLGRRPWFGRIARLFVPADRLVGRLTRGRVVALGLVPSLVITTTGRRSGRTRCNPLLYVPDGDAFVVIASNWGQTRQPAWALNLLADPAATVTVKGRQIPVRAHLVSGPDRDRLWRLLVARWGVSARSELASPAVANEREGLAYETYVDGAAGRQVHIFRLEPFGGRPPAA